MIHLSLIVPFIFHCTGELSLLIQIKWKVYFAVIIFLNIRSLPIFLHATTTQLSCHVQNFVVITRLKSGLECYEISVNSDSNENFSGKLAPRFLTHWGRVTHICVGIIANIGSDNGVSPVRRQAIIWSSAGILLIGPLATNFSEILIEILTFSFKKMRLKVSSAKWRPSCLGLNVLTLNVRGPS